MKIVVTGSLGNISKPLTEILVSLGQEVTVISSDPKKQEAIRAMGAAPANGSITDLEFLTNSFKGADAVYAMIPLSFTEPDLGAYLHRVAQNAEELLLLPKQKTIRYVGSEEMTCNEAAQIIGTAVGKPWLKWVLLSDKEMLQGLKMAKVPEKLAETLVEMQAAMHSGKTLENFHLNLPKMGKVKLADFAKEFAAVYHKK